MLQCSGACADKSTCGVSDVIRIINKLIADGTSPRWSQAA